MRVGTRLTSGFFLLTLLMGLVGYIGTSSAKIIQQNNQIELNERKLAALLDRSLVLTLQLIETKNLSEYNRIKRGLEDTRKEFDVLNKETKQRAYGFLREISDFEKNTGKFTIISNGIISVHKEKLIQNKELVEKEALEKDLRYNAIRIPVDKLNNPALITSAASIEYYSKEAIYQYKDLQHINEWLDSIQTTKSEIEQLELQQDQKNSLLQNITSYQFIAKRLGEIVIDQKKAEDTELLEVDKLTEIIKKLQVDKEKMISNIHAKNTSLASRILKILLIEIIIMLFIAVSLGLYIARSISKPIIELRDLALKISRGQWGEKIKLKSRDEIGELGTAFNKMTEDLQKTTVSVKVLEEEQKRFQDVTQNTGDWVWEVDDQGRYTYVSPVVEQILGYKPQEVIGKYFYDFFHPDDKEELKKAAFEVFSKKEELRNFLNRNIRKDGQIVLIETTGVPVVDENGRLFGYRGADRDISERKRAEEALRASKNKYRMLLENLPQKVFHKDRNSVYISCNENYARDLKIKLEEIAGKTDYDFYPKELAEKYIADDKRIMDSGKAAEIEEKYIQEGRELTVHTVKTPIKDEQGNVIGILGIFWDITEKKKAEEVLKEYTKKIEQINKELDDFTYIVSHDLKEPLRSIDAFSKFLEDDYKEKLSEEGRRYIERIRANATRMQNLIEDLLEISRIERKRSSLEEVDAEGLLGEVKLHLEYAIKEKNVEIVIQDNLPKIFCDRVRLVEVFVNLVSNAIKFNDKPNPRIEVGCNQRDNCYEFYVKDNGLGIEQQYYEKIFEIFQRLGKREDAKGTGAGLTIVKKIIEMHRGKIWVDSKVGEYTTFYFTIPKKKEAILGKRKIGEILVEKKLVTKEELKKALEEQRETG